MKGAGDRFWGDTDPDDDEPPQVMTDEERAAAAVAAAAAKRSNILDDNPNFANINESNRDKKKLIINNKGLPKATKYANIRIILGASAEDASDIKVNKYLRDLEFYLK